MKKNKTTYRSATEKKQLQDRLRTIEGQVRGIIGMIENERYCGDVLIQISAIRESLKSLGCKVLKNHIATSIVDDIKQDNQEGIEEIVSLIQKIN